MKRSHFLPLVLFGAFSPAAWAHEPSDHPFRNIDSAEVERVRSTIAGRTIIVDWRGFYDFTKIQDALDAAVDGDTIIVLPSTGSPAGAYVENIAFPVRAIALRSINPEDPAIVAATVIDGNQDGSVVVFSETTPPTSSLQGFTIRNGSANFGGGIDVDRAAPTLTDLILTGNYSYWNGGALCLSGSDAVLRNITVVDNYAFQAGGGVFLAKSSPTILNMLLSNNQANRGGGLYMEGSAPTLSHGTIADNEASDDGGGLYISESFPTITNITFLANTADYGGAIYSTSSSPTIANSVIVNNTADYGGGLYVVSFSAWLANNTITGNVAYDGGGGLYLQYASLTMANSIIAFNTSGIGASPEYSDDPILRHNCVHGNFQYNYAEVLSDPTGTDGNFSADPGFAHVGCGNIHIRGNSPCANTADEAFVYGDVDIDGQPRIDTRRGAPDIGADEWSGEIWPVGPDVIVRVSPQGNDSLDGSTWTNAKRTVQAGIDAASALCGEVWVQEGLYQERITLHPYAYVFGGFDGDETHRDGRNWIANSTILDGGRAGLVVSAREGHRVSRIDGFVITNGIGGIGVSRASPTIANNIVSGNLHSGLRLFRSFAIVTDCMFAYNYGANFGGGIYIASSSPTIANCHIIGNRADVAGGGVSIATSDPLIVASTVSGNSSVTEGGGIYMLESDPWIVGCRVSDNDAKTNGGGLSLVDSTPAISTTVIAGNSARTEGGGLSVLHSSPAIANATIVSNAAGTLLGGAMYLFNSSPTIVNSVMTLNSSGILQELPSAPPILRHNCVGGNSTYDFSGLLDPAGTDGNISARPTFVQDPTPGADGKWATPDDEPGDLRLAPGSPGVDAGDNAAVPIDSFDLDGNGNTEEPLPYDVALFPRFVDDAISPDSGSQVRPMVDMGAYETPSRGDCDENGSLSLGDLSTVADCTSGPGIAIAVGCLCSDIDLDSDSDLRDFSILQRALR